LAACSPSDKKEVATNQTFRDSEKAVQETDQDTTDFDCTRGEPEPSLDSTVFPNRQFLLIDRKSATEAVNLENGDKITIRHGGCEYFIQTYRFETSRFQADTTDI